MTEFEDQGAGAAGDPARIPAPAMLYADRILRYSANVPCLSALLGEDTDPLCECYGCAGRRYVGLLRVAGVASGVLASDATHTIPVVAPTDGGGANG